MFRSALSQRLEKDFPGKKPANDRLLLTSVYLTNNYLRIARKGMALYTPSSDAFSWSANFPALLSAGFFLGMLAYVTQNPYFLVTYPFLCFGAKYTTHEAERKNDVIFSIRLLIQLAEVHKSQVEANPCLVYSIRACLKNIELLSETISEKSSTYLTSQEAESLEKLKGYKTPESNFPNAEIKTLCEEITRTLPITPKNQFTKLKLKIERMQDFQSLYAMNEFAKNTLETMQTFDAEHQRTLLDLCDKNMINPLLSIMYSMGMKILKRAPAIPMPNEIIAKEIKTPQKKGDLTQENNLLAITDTMQMMLFSYHHAISQFEKHATSMLDYKTTLNSYQSWLKFSKQFVSFCKEIQWPENVLPKIPALIKTIEARLPDLKMTAQSKEKEEAAKKERLQLEKEREKQALAKKKKEDKEREEERKKQALAKDKERREKAKKPQQKAEPRKSKKAESSPLTRKSRKQAEKQRKAQELHAKAKETAAAVMTSLADRVEEEVLLKEKEVAAQKAKELRAEAREASSAIVTSLLERADRESIRREKEKSVLTAVEAFLNTYPAIREFMEKNRLCLTGGAIRDIYWVHQIYKKPEERKLKWKKYIHDLDFIAPRDTVLVTLQPRIKEGKIIPAKSRMANYTPTVLKGSIDPFPIDIHVPSKNSLEEELTQADFTVASIGYTLPSRLISHGSSIDDLKNLTIHCLASEEEITKVFTKDPRRLFRLLELWGKFIIYKGTEQKDHLSTPVRNSLRKLVSNPQEEAMRQSLTLSQILSLLLKTFLNGRGVMHYELAKEYGLLPIFFNHIVIHQSTHYSHDFIELFKEVLLNQDSRAQQFLKNALLHIDSAVMEEKEERVIFFFSTLVRLIIDKRPPTPDSDFSLINQFAGNLCAAVHYLPNISHIESAIIQMVQNSYNMFKPEQSVRNFSFYRLCHPEVETLPQVSGFFSQRTSPSLNPEASPFVPSALKH